MEIKVKVRDNPEKKQELLIRQHLESKGWFVIKTHGNAFQSGLPDLYICHERYGSRWVEVKTDTGRLTPAQEHTFKRLAWKGVQIYIVRNVDDCELLLKPCGNWKIWVTNPHEAFTRVA